MKCIAVDDDPFWLGEICSALDAEGVEVFPALSGVDGLAMLDRHPDASMVLDIILPDRDGLEVLRDARAKHPDVKVLAISAGGRLGANFYLRLADTLGADAIIEKPFTAQQLVAGWRRAVEGRSAA